MVQTKEEKATYDKKYCQENKEARRIRSKEWYLENKEEKAIYARKDYQKNREERLAYANCYRQGHREEKLVYNKKYLYDHPKIHRRASRKHRLKKQQLKESYTTEQWNEKVAATHGICSQCGRKYVDVSPFCVTIDHCPSINITPIGFCYTINDVSPVCGSCNSSNYVHSNDNTVLENFGGIK